jgi:hypothetical protein
LHEKFHGVERMENSRQQSIRLCVGRLCVG